MAKTYKLYSNFLTLSILLLSCTAHSTIGEVKRGTVVKKRQSASKATSTVRTAAKHIYHCFAGGGSILVNSLTAPYQVGGLIYSAYQSDDKCSQNIENKIGILAVVQPTVPPEMYARMLKPGTTCAKLLSYVGKKIPVEMGRITEKLRNRQKLSPEQIEFRRRYRVQNYMKSGGLKKATDLVWKKLNGLSPEQKTKVTCQAVTAVLTGGALWKAAKQARNSAKHGVTKATHHEIAKSSIEEQIAVLAETPTAAVAPTN